MFSKAFESKCSSGLRENQPRLRLLSTINMLPLFLFIPCYYGMRPDIFINTFKSPPLPGHKSMFFPFLDRISLETLTGSQSTFHGLFQGEACCLVFLFTFIVVQPLCRTYWGCIAWFQMGTGLFSAIPRSPFLVRYSKARSLFRCCSN